MLLTRGHPPLPPATHISTPAAAASRVTISADAMPNSRRSSSAGAAWGAVGASATAPSPSRSVAAEAPARRCVRKPPGTSSAGGAAVAGSNDGQKSGGSEIESVRSDQTAAARAAGVLRAPGVASAMASCSSTRRVRSQKDFVGPLDCAYRRSPASAAGSCWREKGAIHAVSHLYHWAPLLPEHPPPHS